ncbi:MAG TPA: cytochrome c biogenesis protein CcsA [Fimbriimonadaceae bacterium]|nr:cytochrome c biogenesis protein CcsA [Fimbriimonadaceae bacterium]
MNDLGFNDLVSPPAWSLALGVVGRILVVASAALFAVSAIAWLRSVKTKKLEALGKFGFTAASWSVIGAFIVLGILFATQRYEYEYIFQHSDRATSLAYHIAGIWSGQQGSFLLWATCSAIFALLTTRRTEHYRRWYSVAFAFFLGGITSILAFESPFNLTMFNGQVVVPPDGAGLSPSLHNYWVTIHPPTIFLGFGSLTCLFALAFAALATRDYERWIPIVRPWGIVSVALVGLGLCMGGFWAYETLGWGGFWMWDPVENVSFVPWVFAAAFTHGVIVQATKKRWKMTNLLLAALPFVIFLYGTFLTRSGVLGDTSVHSFAEMDRYALKLLLVLMGGTVLGFGGLWAFRAIESLKDKAPEEPGPVTRREGFYMLGVASLLVLGTLTAIGMSIPLFMAMANEKPRVVEESLYHQVLSWIFIPLMLLMAVTPFVSWKGMKFREIGSKAYTIFCVTVGVTGLFLIAAVLTPFASQIDMKPEVTMLGSHKIQGMAWVVILFAICVFVIVGNGWRVLELFKRSKLGITPFLAHVGVAVLMAGLGL